MAKFSYGHVGSSASAMLTSINLEMGSPSLLEVASRNAGMSSGGMADKLP